MFDSQNSSAHDYTQPAKRDHSLAASLSKWYPRSDIYSKTLRATFRAYKREQRLAQAIARLAVSK